MSEQDDKLYRCMCGGALRMSYRQHKVDVIRAQCERCGRIHSVHYTEAYTCACERLIVRTDYDDYSCDWSCANNVPMREQRRRYLEDSITNPVLLGAPGAMRPARRMGE